VLTFEELDPSLGTTADAYRQVSPWIYTMPDFLHPALYWAFLAYLFKRLEPKTLYIANGTTWIYDALYQIKQHFPGIRVANQVYDSVVGWINRYDLALAMYINAHIGVNSKICQAYIQKGANPQETYLIENGIEPDELNPADYPAERVLELKQRLELPIDKKIITFASRLHPQKRPIDFLELARRFSLDEAKAFLLVGDGPLAPVVEEQITKIGLRNIYRKPFYRPISDILAVTDVLVLPSEFEGMPMIVIEAQAMGKPVVVTDVGNHREILERTQGGVVVSRIGDIPSLIDGVLRMLEEPPDPHQLRQATLEHFDIAIVAQKYYQALIGEEYA
jgi:glycosyltransferase involved in cell wall biosynthesis